MKTTQDAVEDAVKAIGAVLTELVATVDANARRAVRTEVSALLALDLEPAPHANGIAPSKSKTKKSKPTLRPSKPKTKVSTARDSGRRSPEEMSQLAARLFTHINAHPGARAEEIAEKLGMQTKELPAPIKMLLKEKKIRATGKARGTTYTAVD